MSMNRRLARVACSALLTLAAWPVAGQTATGPHQDRHRPPHRRGRSAALRQLRRAPRPDDLRRHLRGRQPALATPTATARTSCRPSRTWASRILRWPGGNFASGYNWKDGIGPKDKRPARPRSGLERHREQPVRHRRVPQVLRARSAPSRTSASTPASARSTMRGTGWSTPTSRAAHLLGRPAAQERARGAVQRRSTGASATRSTARGRWATRRAEDYAKFALEAGKAMRAVDPSHQADRQRLEQLRPTPTGSAGTARCCRRCATTIDYIALHTYIGNRENDLEQFLAASSGRRPIASSRRPVSSRRCSPGGPTSGRSTSPTTSGTSGTAPGQDRGKHARGDLQLRGRAGDGDVLQLLLPPRRRREDGEPGAARQRHRADHDQQAGPVPAADLLPARRVRQAARATSRSTSSSRRRPTRSTERPGRCTISTYRRRIDPRTRKVFVNVLNRSKKNDLTARIENMTGGLDAGNSVSGR